MFSISFLYNRHVILYIPQRFFYGTDTKNLIASILIKDRLEILFRNDTKSHNDILTLIMPSLLYYFRLLHSLYSQTLITVHLLGRDGGGVIVEPVVLHPGWYLLSTVSLISTFILFFFFFFFYLMMVVKYMCVWWLC